MGEVLFTTGYSIVFAAVVYAVINFLMHGLMGYLFRSFDQYIIVITVAIVSLQLYELFPYDVLLLPFYVVVAWIVIKVFLLFFKGGKR